MNFDDSRGNQNYPHRRPSPHKNSYSPNSVYYGNSAHNNQQQQQQKKKHHSVHNKGNMSNDRLIKQNDAIIKLLKEIRDRLPAPAGTPVSDNGEDYIQRNNVHQEKVSSQTDDSDEVDTEDNDGEFDSADEDSFEVENEQN